MGRFSGATLTATTIKAPWKIPAAPIPAIARPTIRADDVVALPQTAEPTSKNKMADNRIPLSENEAYMAPKTSWNEQLVRRYAVPYQLTSSRAWNWSTIRGMAVDKMVLS